MKIDAWHSDTVPNPLTQNTDVLVLDEDNNWICTVPVYRYRTLQDAQAIAASIAAAHNIVELMREAIKQ